MLSSIIEFVAIKRVVFQCKYVFLLWSDNERAFKHHTFGCLIANSDCCITKVLGDIIHGIYILLAFPAYRYDIFVGLVYWKIARIRLIRNE
jgi:hypothetical protein